MIVWPAFLPCIQEGITPEVKGAYLIDSGVNYQISRVEGQKVETFPAQFLFTGREFQVFERFHQAHISFGTAWFEGEIQGASDTYQAIMRIVNGAYTADYVANDIWRINLSIEVWKDAQFT